MVALGLVGVLFRILRGGAGRLVVDAGFLPVIVVLVVVVVWFVLVRCVTFVWLVVFFSITFGIL